jgi:hypothetical protein
MKKTKVTFVKGYHGSDGYMNPGQSFETTAEHAKQLAKDGFIEVEEKEEKTASQTKEEKIVKDSK